MPAAKATKAASICAIELSRGLTYSKIVAKAPDPIFPCFAIVCFSKQPVASALRAKIRASLLAAPSIRASVA